MYLYVHDIVLSHRLYTSCLFCHGEPLKGARNVFDKRGQLISKDNMLNMITLRPAKNWITFWILISSVSYAQLYTRNNCELQKKKIVENSGKYNNIIITIAKLSTKIILKINTHKKFGRRLNMHRRRRRSTYYMFYRNQLILMVFPWPAANAFYIAAAHLRNAC